MKKRNRIKGQKNQSDFAMSLDEIAKIEGCCKQLVSRLIQNAIKKLQRPHIKNNLINYI
jgi:DNA-directed RNA polymerase specialized sigma24 family protein